IGVVLLIGLPRSAPPPAPPMVQAAQPHEAAAPRPAAAAPAPARAPEAPAPETVVLSVSVVPQNAQFFLDEELMPSNPFLGRFPKSTRTHRLRAVAPGYLPKERLVSF